MADVCVKYFSGNEKIFRPRNGLFLLGIFNSYHNFLELEAGLVRRIAADRRIRDGPGSSFSIRRSLAFDISNMPDIVVYNFLKIIFFRM
jgi:hypothetical protein